MSAMRRSFRNQTRLGAGKINSGVRVARHATRIRKSRHLAASRGSCRIGRAGWAMAPRVGFEPTTIRLTVECSTAELSGNCGPYSKPAAECKWVWSNFAAAGIPGFLHRLCIPLLPNPSRHCYTGAHRDWPRGGMVTQRTANPCIPVRFWARPPHFFDFVDAWPFNERPA